MKEKRVPNAEQLAALRNFAEWHGRNWKSVLSEAWMRGGMGVAGYTTPLQQVRSNFGPSWLVKFKLPKETPAQAGFTGATTSRY